MRVLIFGASGFIGSSLVSWLTSSGHEVVALSRTSPIPGFCGRCIFWEMGVELPHDLGEIDCAIHLTHDFDGDEGAAKTLFGVLKAVKDCHNLGIKRQLFFSSYSAGDYAKSLYGKTKYMLEQSISNIKGAIIIRPGLVLGDGGIYGRIKRFAKKYPIVPFPGGHGKVPVIEINILCAQIESIALGRLGNGPFNLFEDRFYDMRDLIIHATSDVARKPLLVPIPINWMIFGLYIAAALKIKLPVNLDNLDGFIANQTAKHVSTMNKDI
jgi:nucleoside-diphosphate-sugar epimerase